MLGSAFVGGLASSLGPCVAPRYLLLATLLGRGLSRAARATLIAGTISGYLVYVVAGEAIVRSQLGSHAAYGMLALMLVAAGVAGMGRPSHRCAPRESGSRSLGSTFLCGALGALTFSPCCTPIAVALGIGVADGNGYEAIAALLAFGVGHALPSVFGAFGLLPIVGRDVSPAFRRASTVVATALLLALGALYGLLA